MLGGRGRGIAARTRVKLSVRDVPKEAHDAQGRQHVKLDNGRFLQSPVNDCVESTYSNAQRLVIFYHNYSSVLTSESSRASAPKTMNTYRGFQMNTYGFFTEYVKGFSLNMFKGFH